MKRLTMYFMVAGLTLIAFAQVAFSAADTQGIVSHITTRPVSNGKHVVQIYFSSHTYDRWNCLSTLGHIELNDATPYLDAKGLDRAFSLAVTALVTGMPLGVDSPAADPCLNANQVWLIK